jgi:hypothetical protein
MALRIGAAAALLAALAGCAGPAEAPSAAGPAATSVTAEPGGRFVTFVGPRRQHAEPFLGVPGTNFFALRSWLDTRSGEVSHQLYVEDSYFGAEKKWEKARDKTGGSLRFVAIAKNEISCDQGCSFAEEFAVALPEALLRANPQGLSVTIAAHSGAERTIAVPGDLVARQLAAVDAARASRPATAAAAGR